MKKCRVCLCECEDLAELCPVCGAELDFEAAADNDETVIIEKPVMVAAVEDIVTAEIFKDVLKENNIPYSLGEDQKETGIKIGFGGEFITEKIYVDETNLDKATELYNEVLSSEPQFEDFEDFEEEN
ncbi:MAG: hypothetical protein IJZ75_05240 [Clostridia bacterium]|nr:hypothetical protein [Clostridia bacterium]